MPASGGSGGIIVWRNQLARQLALTLVAAVLVSTAAFAFLVVPARAATTYPPPLHHVDGTMAGERSGTSVALIDLNQDGVADLVVGAPYNGTSATGSVTFYLSKLVVSTIVPFATAITTFGWPGSLFGFSVANVGNVAGRGPTLAVGAPLASPNGLGGAGNVTLFYPSVTFDGKARAWINGTHASEELGYSLAAAGDINGDTFDDLLAGAPFCGASANGCAYVFFGGNPPHGTPAMTFTTASAGAHFGFSVAGNGSVDSNSALDIAVGAPDQASSTGAVYIIRNLMGTGGSVNRTTTVAGTAAGDRFGYSVAMADFNGDTFSDVAVGAPGANAGAGTVAILYGGSRFNGAIGATLSGSAGESFGRAVSAGNFHRDQFDDLLVGAPTSTVNSTGVGRAYGFYGSIGVPSTPNVTLVPSSGDNAFGAAVSVGGDINGDASPDFVIGDPQFTSGPSSNLGRAVAFLGTVVATLVNPTIQGWVCQPNTWRVATKSCLGLQGFIVTLQSATVTKTTTTLANGSFSFSTVRGTYFVNTTEFPYIDNSTSLSVDVNTVYTVLVFPRTIPHVYGIAKDAVNRTGFAGVRVALYNATGALVNATTTPGTSSRNYSVYIPPAFIPALGSSLGLTVRMWDSTHYLNTTSTTVARNESVNASMFLNRFPLVAGKVLDISTTIPVAGAIVQATQGATVVATATTNNQGNYNLVAVNATVPATLFLNITAAKYVRAQASRGVNQNASYVQNVFLQADTIAPTSQISPLLPTYTNTALVPITATASDNNPNNVAQVQLYYRFNKTGTFALYGSDSVAPYALSVNTTALRGDGTYEFYTIAVDYGGNQQVKPNGNMTWTIVDTRAPSSALAALPAYETVANFTLTATARDWNPIAQVGLLYRKGTSGGYTLLSNDATRPYSWYFNTTALSTGDGVYEFYSLATDAAGNVEAIPSTPDARTTVDTTPPVLTISSPTAGQVVGTGYVNVTWTATDLTSGIAKYDVRLDSGAWVHAGTRLYYNFTLVPDGSHTVAVNVTDTAGNSKTVSAAFTVSTVSPVVAISAPASSAIVASSSLAVTWSVSNAGAGLMSIQIRLDSGGWQTLAPTATSYTFTSVADGAHTAYVQAIGLNGAQGTASVTVTVDTTPPTVSITAPVTNVWSTRASVIVSFTAADTTSGLMRVMLSVDGGASVNVTGTGNYTVTGLADGSHTVTVTATDHAGHTATASVTVRIDTTAPSVSITAPSANAVLPPGNITVTWTAADGGSGLSQAQISVDGGAFQTVTGGSTVLTGLSNGAHTIVVRATDVAGNLRTASVTFTIARSTGGPGPGLDPLVVAVVAAGVVIVVVALVAYAYTRRKKSKGPEAPHKEPEELEKKGGET